MKLIKKKNTKIITIISIVFLLSSFIILNIFIPDNYKLILRIPRDGLSYMTNIITNPLIKAKNKLDKTLIDSNYYMELEKQINDYENIINLNNELVKEINLLKEELNLNSILVDDFKVNATTINRNLDYFNDSLTIDKGKKDGIKKDMGVVFNNYLIGKIEDVSFSTSKVMLLTNNAFNKLSIKIDVNGKDIYGLLIRYDKGLYKIEGITDVIDIPLNSSILTTGLSDNIPSGIMIGTVSNVTTDNFDLAKLVEGKPGINFNDISYVTVVGKK